jgi:hypothetical protein
MLAEGTLLAYSDDDSVVAPVVMRVTGSPARTRDR